MYWVSKIFAGLLIVIGVLASVLLAVGIAENDVVGLALSVVFIVGPLVLGALLWRRPPRRVRSTFFAVVGSLFVIFGLFAIGIEVDAIVADKVEDPVFAWSMAAISLGLGTFLFAKGIKKASAPLLESTVVDIGNDLVVEKNGEQEVFLKYASIRKRQIVVTLPVWIFTMAAFMFQDSESGYLLGVTPFVWGPAVVVVFGAFVYWTVKNWRCPSCVKYLGRGMNPRHCPNCGQQLRK